MNFRKKLSQMEVIFQALLNQFHALEKIHHVFLTSNKVLNLLLNSSMKKESISEYYQGWA